MLSNVFPIHALGLFGSAEMKSCPGAPSRRSPGGVQHRKSIVCSHLGRLSGENMQRCVQETVYLYTSTERQWSVKYT